MKILIMDDDAAVRFMLNEICESAGWDVLVGSNGREGLERFRTESVDVVLVDYHMPEMDGLRTVQEIRKLNTHVPILVLTVDERQEIADRFLDAGATDFAIKPVRAPDLISRIQLHLRLSSLTRPQKESGESPADQPLPEFDPPKGISATTLRHIVSFLCTRAGAYTIDEITKEVGLAYPTVYRSLVYLMQQGKVRTIVNYQKVGRPKNKYEWRT
ncbi:response regulator [Aneurinibacillus sp. BA2021]|nr:response regulator [Aneurinibacillus sp. BA2021]